MTLTKRIIPCLDVKNGRVVKGLNFESIKDAGDPVELAAKYSDEGADELVFLDITASNEQRETIKELVRKVASVINIPFTVGGGVKSIDDARNMSKVKPKVNSEMWEYEVYCDPNGDFKRAMGVGGVPHTFLLNSKKEIVWQHTGYKDGDEYELYEQIEALSK